MLGLAIPMNGCLPLWTSRSLFSPNSLQQQLSLASQDPGGDVGGRVSSASSVTPHPFQPQLALPMDTANRRL